VSVDDEGLAAAFGLGKPAGQNPDGQAADAEHPDDRLAAIARRYTPVDWDAAWKDLPGDVQWLIEPVLEAGTVNAMFAKVDTGKSLMALEWALRLVREGRTVVYVDEENRIGDAVERLQAFGAGPGELARLRFYSFAGLPPLDTYAGGVHLLAIAVTASASLVILDTTTRMVQGRENDSDTFLALYRCSLVPLKSRGITVLRLDHPGKDEERGQRGSSAKDGDCDTIWRLTEVTRGLKYRLRRVKNRSAHAPDSGDLEVDRRFGPVRHVWTCPDRSREIDLIGQLYGQLDRLGIPPSAGRDKCRAALNETGTAISNALLSEVVRQRRFAPDSSGTAGQLSPVSDHLSSSPPHTKWVGERTGGSPVPGRLRSMAARHYRRAEQQAATRGRNHVMTIPATTTPGPFGTEAEVRALPAVQAVYAAFRADPGVGKMIGPNHTLLDALAAAGVYLGGYDHRIAAWLANWEPQTVAVIAGWVQRASEAGASR
jgi:hypothetical protein